MLILRINGWPQLAADCVGGSRGAPLASPAFGLAWLAGGSPSDRCASVGALVDHVGLDPHPVCAPFAPDPRSILPARGAALPRSAPPDRPRSTPPAAPETTAARAAQRRGGRPAVAPEARRSQTIGVCVSAAEAAQLRRVAAQVGMKPSTFLRAAALGVVPRVVPEGNRTHWLALGKLTATLTQLMAARTRGLPVTLDKRLVTALRAEVRALRCALLGADDGSAWGSMGADDAPTDAPADVPIGCTAVPAVPAEVPTSSVQGSQADSFTLPNSAALRGNAGAHHPPHSPAFGITAVPEFAGDARPFGTGQGGDSGPIGTADARTALSPVPR